MSDIEVKRKELETAKRIRVVGYACRNGDEISCFECTLDEYGLCRDQKNQEIDAFISTREAELAELAELEKVTNADTGCLTPSDAIAGTRHMGSAQEPHQSDWQKTGEIPTATGKADIMQDMSKITNSDPAMYTGYRAPSLDDFALALIQGGYFNMTMGEDAAISNLVSRAEKIKAAIDARRDI